MKKLFLLLLFTSLNIYSQIDSVKIKYPKIESTFINIDSLDSSSLYKKSKNWVKKYYNNPDFVLRSDIENEYLRINGVSNYSFKWMGTQVYSFDYTLELNFKNGKIKADFINITTEGKKVPEFFFDNKGVQKKQKVNQEMKLSMEKQINNILFDLYSYLISNQNNW